MIEDDAELEARIDESLARELRRVLEEPDERGREPWLQQELSGALESPELDEWLAAAGLDDAVRRIEANAPLLERAEQARLARTLAADLQTLPESLTPDLMVLFMSFAEAVAAGETATADALRRRLLPGG
jgi:hypothetical protein